MIKLAALFKSPWPARCHVKIPEAEQSEFQSLLDALIEWRAEHNHWYEAKFANQPAYQTMKAMKGRKKVRLLFFLAHHDQERLPGYGVQVSVLLLNQLLRTRIDFAEEDFRPFFKAACLGSRERRIYCHFGQLIRQIDRYITKHGLSEKLAADLAYLLDKQAHLTSLHPNHWEAQLRALLEKGRTPACEAPELEKVLGTGRVGRLLQAALEPLPLEEQQHWSHLLRHCQKARASHPTKKWLQTARAHLEAIGTKQAKAQIQDWLEQITRLETETVVVKHRLGHYSHQEYIEAACRPLLKGLIWCLAPFHDARTLSILAELAERAFQKIPGQGPAAAALGNAAIAHLAQAPGQKGVAQLTRLRLRIKQASTRKRIDEHLAKMAEKAGLTIAQLEEHAVPDFGLKQGVLEAPLGEYHLRLILQGPGKTRLEWRRADGKVQKSVPAAIRRNRAHANRLAEMRQRAREIQKLSAAQRDRIERLYLEEISWPLDQFQGLYLEHGLLGPISRKLVWQIDGQPALFHNGRWEDAQGQPLNPDKQAEVRLWHPLHSEVERRMAWRARLAALGITQPFKQAWREIYVPTPAEAETRLYSNRMAAHILKQHQFSALVAARGWRYGLLGAFDDGRDHEVAQRALPAFKLTAQFWIDAPQDYDGEAWNDAGIWNHVLTDQLRFVDPEGELVPLLEVPGQIFSEILRDLDLFVGVASVGNDPNWRDSGPGVLPEWRDYWQDFAFGELNAVAQTRKAVLETLLPRLKIRDRARIDGRFLVVRGQLHQYRIHIGSANVLIAPENRYLCIVAGGRNQPPANLFLPFEGDHGLALVLSKALLLADDHKIDDPTILRQL